MAWSGRVAVTSDYVYRGVSLRDEKPSPLVQVRATLGAFYADVLLIGTELGDDALGRSIGDIEADATFGFNTSFRNVDFDFGAKYTGYPNGRDLVVGTLAEAERDFIEPFARATVNLGEGYSLGAFLAWTPDFYYETGNVTTLEGQAAIPLPALGPVHSRLTSTVGRAWSENANVVSPGNGYLYYNLGIEGQIDRFIFDLRYWNTDVDKVDGYEQRFVLAVGMMFT